MVQVDMGGRCHLDIELPLILIAKFSRFQAPRGAGATVGMKMMVFTAVASL